MGNMNMYLIFALLISIGEINLSNALSDEEESRIFSEAMKFGDTCQNVGPSMHKCAPEIIKIIKQDGHKTTNELPSKQCCSELLSLGETCYYDWMNYEVSSLPTVQEQDLFTWSNEFLVNIDTVWTGCESKVL
nr:hypothetical protein Iba_chr07eCG11580 [Ipomoea batatas]